MMRNSHISLPMPASNWLNDVLPVWQMFLFQGYHPAEALLLFENISVLKYLWRSGSIASALLRWSFQIPLLRLDCGSLKCGSHSQTDRKHLHHYGYSGDETASRPGQVLFHYLA